VKQCFKDFSDKWDIMLRNSNHEDVKERRNKGYQFLKQVESLADTSGESGMLKKRKSDKQQEHINQNQSLNNDHVQVEEEKMQEEHPRESDDEEFDSVELGNMDS